MQLLFLRTVTHLLFPFGIVTLSLSLSLQSFLFNACGSLDFKVLNMHKQYQNVDVLAQRTHT
jgi:hypothetical protein